MSRKRITIIFLIGILVGILIVSPILTFLGVPSFSDFLTNIFG
ncbi:hypothetical protein [Bacillus sp. J14TS2]|nr:hypothetical protein [Bacillus sp. J14TS2]